MPVRRFSVRSRPAPDVRENETHGDDAHEKDAKPQKLSDARFQQAVLDDRSAKATVVPDGSERDTPSATGCRRGDVAPQLGRSHDAKRTGRHGPAAKCHGPFCPSLGGGPLL